MNLMRIARDAIYARSVLYSTNCLLYIYLSIGCSIDKINNKNIEQKMVFILFMLRIFYTKQYNTYLLAVPLVLYLDYYCFYGTF